MGDGKTSITFDRQLIKCIENNPVIYKKSNRNKCLVEERWEEIGKVLNKNIDFCKRRWIALRTSYTRLKKRGCHTQKYMDGALTFLDDYIIHRTSKEPGTPIDIKTNLTETNLVFTDSEDESNRNDNVTYVTQDMIKSLLNNAKDDNENNVPTQSADDCEKLLIKTGHGAQGKNYSKIVIDNMSIYRSTAQRIPTGIPSKEGCDSDKCPDFVLDDDNIDSPLKEQATAVKNNYIEISLLSSDSEDESDSKSLYNGDKKINMPNNVSQNSVNKDGGGETRSANFLNVIRHKRTEDQRHFNYGIEEVKKLKLEKITPKTLINNIIEEAHLNNSKQSPVNDIPQVSKIFTMHTEISSPLVYTKRLSDIVHDVILRETTRDHKSNPERIKAYFSKIAERVIQLPPDLQSQVQFEVSQVVSEAEAAIKNVSTYRTRNS